MSLDIHLLENKCPKCGRSNEVYWANITHNLADMAIAVGIYNVLWRADEHGVKTAEQLIEPLEDAIALLIAHPSKYRDFDSPNGWGTYDNFLPWLKELLEACKNFPAATVEVNR